MKVVYAIIGILIVLVLALLAQSFAQGAALILYGPDNIETFEDGSYRHYFPDGTYIEGCNPGALCDDGRY